MFQPRSILSFIAVVLLPSIGPRVRIGQCHQLARLRRAKSAEFAPGSRRRKPRTLGKRPSISTALGKFATPTEARRGDARDQGFKVEARVEAGRPKIDRNGRTRKDTLARSS